MQVGIKVVRLEGSMAMQQRDRMIEAFTTDASVRVFLMSLKAGGVALNLTAASHVMLMDPWWNPAVEQQARPPSVACLKGHMPGWTHATRLVAMQTPHASTHARFPDNLPTRTPLWDPSSQ